MPITLYGAPPSLFSGKARAYLDWKGIDYTEKLPSDARFQSEIVPAIGRQVIPVVELPDGTLLQDTTLIIDHFEAADSDTPGVYPETPRQRLASMLLETYGDEWLVIPAMHYRWHYNEEWIYGEFGKTALPGASPEEQYAAGKARGAIFKGFVPMLGINAETIPVIEQSYEALLADLDAHFAEHAFLLGTRPSIGDYGLIGPLYAHNYRDPKSGEIMRRLAPNVAAWVERMVEPDPLSDEFLGGDRVPDDVLKVLHRMMTEQLPYLAHVAEMLGEWAKANPGAELPRALGLAPFTIEGVTSERAALPFSLWMLQRALDYIASLGGEDRAACEEMLTQCGGEALLPFEIPVRLEFEDFVQRVAQD
ncbi:glutathione S-transferase family protein [Erythrobacter sp. YT30]|uniref:glutathione S-transferase family protein n=1 Tax=Erythrobacter sp. YT30 TaxID=1735012 RepID=UPI00076C6C1A|nr:glutathione S-transferase family protein [Erythrobacter sp. YT30]KWV91572.1 glutathione S-transferase [Erythrobacter sp. YT30]